MSEESEDPTLVWIPEDEMPESRAEASEDELASVYIDRLHVLLTKRLAKHDPTLTTKRASKTARRVIVDAVESYPVEIDDVDIDDEAAQSWYRRIVRERNEALHGSNPEESVKPRLRPLTSSQASEVWTSVQGTKLGIANILRSLVGGPRPEPISGVD